MVFHTILAPSGGAFDIWVWRRKVHFNHFDEDDLFLFFKKNVFNECEKFQELLFVTLSR